MTTTDLYNYQTTDSKFQKWLGWSALIHLAIFLSILLSDIVAPYINILPPIGWIKSQEQRRTKPRRKYKTIEIKKNRLNGFGYPMPNQLDPKVSMEKPTPSTSKGGTKGHGSKKFESGKEILSAIDHAKAWGNLGSGSRDVDIASGFISTSASENATRFGTSREGKKNFHWSGK